jgi:hypothetical protein
VSELDDGWEKLSEAHRRALADYLAAAEAIRERLATPFAPSAEQLNAEELARRRLFEVRRTILARRRNGAE